METISVQLVNGTLHTDETTKITWK